VILMSWWGILKVQTTLDVGTQAQKPVSEGYGLNRLQQRATQSAVTQPMTTIAGQHSDQQQTPFQQQQQQPALQAKKILQQTFPMNA
jgi:hypothetical protein